MDRPSAKVHITKLSAARRQLCAAIRMYFAGEDELAIHTVASAAYRLICDLKAKRGRDEVGDYFLTMFFYSIREYHRGNLPGYLADNPEAMEWIREMAEKIPITATSRYEDIKTFVSPDDARQFWKKWNMVSNFLKHADNDACSHISIDEVDNFYLLMRAIAAYHDIDKGGLGDEGFVFMIFMCVDSGTVEDLPPEEHEIAMKLELGLVSREERMKRCLEYLRILNEKE